MTEPRELTLRLTAVLLATSVFLIGPSLLGLGASPVLALALLVFAALLYAGTVVLPFPAPFYGHDLSVYQQDLWLGPALAAAAVLFFLGATPGELQALGGLAGAAGMVNYFLRPVYFLAVSLFGRLA
ncbi:MAG: hypothetical protein V5A55_02005 [Halovenus sp.]